MTDKFWGKVEKTESCWIWRGQTGRRGYGRFYASGKNHYAHRFALESTGIEVPDDMLVDHQCRNHSCVNPAHLRVVTKQVNNVENSEGFSAVNAQKTNCPDGHPYDSVDYRGYRICLECKRLYDERRRATNARIRKERDALLEEKAALQRTLTASLDRERAGADAITEWQRLYCWAMSCANGLTNYVESRPGLLSIERDLKRIADQARALEATARAAKDKP